MNNKISFKRRIIISFSLIIAVFTAGIILFEQNQIKKERINGLEYTLEKNADIIYKYLKNNNIAIDLNAQLVSQQLQYMEPDLRLTIIDWQGYIIYDNLLNDKTLENHLKRPEIQKSITFGEGSNIRLSRSNKIKYLYYAKKYEEGFLYVWHCHMI
jgi:two-component system phosphate regulon sensor histidine kinase PhoR